MADLLSVGVLFAAVAVVGGVAARLDQSVIPFYIVAGVVLSPSVAGTVEVAGVQFSGVAATEFVTLGKELGIVFLLFFLGLEFNLDRLIAGWSRIGRVGVVDFGLNFTVGLLVGVVLFDGVVAAVLVAGIVYISSSAIITKSLIDLGWIANDEAEPILGTLVFEDLLIAVYLAVVTAVVTGGDAATVASSVTVSLGIVLLLLVATRVGTGALDWTFRTASPEATVLRAVGVTVLVAGAALAAGTSEAVAAFFVGLAFSTTARVDRIEDLLEPLRDVFAAVFFFWIGVSADVSLVLDVLALVVAAALVTTPTKVVSGYLGGRVYELSPRRSVRVGLALVSRGEFSLIIAAVALTADGTTLTASTAESLYAFTVGYVLLMSVLGTLLMRASGPFERLVTPGSGPDDGGHGEATSTARQN